MIGKSYMIVYDHCHCHCHGRYHNRELQYSLKSFATNFCHVQQNITMQQILHPILRDVKRNNVEAANVKTTSRSFWQDHEKTPRVQIGARRVGPTMATPCPCPAGSNALKQSTRANKREHKPSQNTDGRPNKRRGGGRNYQIKQKINSMTHCPLCSVLLAGC